MPFMLKQIYDTICHEHLEYYSLSVIKKILNKAGLKILDINFNKLTEELFCYSHYRNSKKKLIIK